MSPLHRGRPLADTGLTAGQVTAPCPGRPRAAPAQAWGDGCGPSARGAETWPCGWGGREADALARCRPATPGALRGLFLRAPERSASRGRGRRSGAMRNVASQGGKSWRRLAPLPSLAARVPQVGAAGRCWRPGLLRAPGRGWRRRGGRGRRGLGAPGSQWSRSACAGTASCLACLSSGASFLDRRRDPPQRRQERQRLSVNTLLCGGASVVPGRVCACSCG